MTFYRLIADLRILQWLRDLGSVRMTAERIREFTRHE